MRRWAALWKLRWRGARGRGARPARRAALEQAAGWRAGGRAGGRAGWGQRCQAAVVRAEQEAHGAAPPACRPRLPRRQARRGAHFWGVGQPSKPRTCAVHAGNLSMRTCGEAVRACPHARACAGAQCSRCACMHAGRAPGARPRSCREAEARGGRRRRAGPAPRAPAWSWALGEPPCRPGSCGEAAAMRESAGVASQRSRWQRLRAAAARPRCPTAQRQAGTHVCCCCCCRRRRRRRRRRSFPHPPVRQVHLDCQVHALAALLLQGSSGAGEGGEAV